MQLKVHIKVYKTAKSGGVEIVFGRVLEYMYVRHRNEKTTIWGVPRSLEFAFGTELGVKVPAFSMARRRSGCALEGWVFTRCTIGSAVHSLHL